MKKTKILGDPQKQDKKSEAELLDCAAKIIQKFCDAEVNDCRFDHHGDRQEHGFSDPCLIKESHEWLKEFYWSNYCNKH